MLIRHLAAVVPSVLAVVTIVAGAVVSRLTGRSDPAWLHPQP